MKILGSQIVSSKQNNLNSIRLFLALVVILSHSFPLCFGLGGEAMGEPMSRLTRHQVSSGSVAVNLFFFISGLLITASWLRSVDMADFLMKRILRIYPAFVVAIGFSVVVSLGFCPEFRNGVGYGVSLAVLFIKDCLFLTMSSISQEKIFSRNPFPGTANGSLWSIPVEFRCYLVVAAIGLFCLYRHRFFVLCGASGIYFLYAVGLFGFHRISPDNLRLLMYFLFGINAWLWRDRIPFSKWIALGGLIILVTFSQFKPWFLLMFPIFGCYCALWVGFGPKLVVSEWLGKTDISYGVYLYAFPIQQLIASFPDLRNPLLMFFTATPATLALAWLSWHLVEKRFLAMKNIKLIDFDPGFGKDQ
jgi:peptidoglycan/LPS O-acetylase OafA/YrhL